MSKQEGAFISIYWRVRIILKMKPNRPRNKALTIVSIVIVSLIILSMLASAITILP
jgi:hypothetical protein